MTVMPMPKKMVAKDGTETYKVRFRHEGLNSSRTFNDYKSALTFSKTVSEVGAKVALETLDDWHGKDGEVMTVEQWCLQYIGGKVGAQEDTLARYRRYVANDLGSLRNRPIAVVTQDHINQWVKAHAQAGSAHGTIANKHGFLAGAFKDALSRDLISRNPCAATRIPRTVDEEMVFLSEDEFARFLEFFTPYWKPFVVTMFATGLRFSEITAVQVGDVDLQAGTLRVSRAWKRNGKTGPPKSKRSRRTISLPLQAVTAIEGQSKGKPGDALVFTNTQGRRVHNGTFHENVWGPAVRLANGQPAAKGKRVGRRRDETGKVIEPAKVPLGKSPRPHDARHTCASWLLGAGVPIHYVQAHLGHESITTTVGTYGHLMPHARQVVTHSLEASLSIAVPIIDAAEEGLPEIEG